MPALRSDNARLLRASIVIHDFDQWTNANDTLLPGCACTCFFAPGPNQDYAA